MTPQKAAVAITLSLQDRLALRRGFCRGAGPRRQRDCIADHLPETVTTYYYRGDSACHESDLINWLRDESRAEGPRGRIGFAISARMSEALKKAMEKLPEERCLRC